MACASSPREGRPLKVWDDISVGLREGELIEGTISAGQGWPVGQHQGRGQSILARLAGRPSPVRNLDAHRQTYKFKVIKFNKKRGNIVLSRRVLLEKEPRRAQGPDPRASEGRQIVEGIVKNLTEYLAPSSISAASTGSCTSPTELGRG